MSLALLRGIAISLNTQMTMVRRHLADWDEARLRQELALSSALLDEVRQELGEEPIAAQRETARTRLRPHELQELDCASGYALWAESYHEQSDNPLTALEGSLLEPLLKDVVGLRLLDVGCGTGRHALRLAARGANVTGLDPSPQMLSVARHEARRLGLALDLREGGFGDLPLEEPFDLVICNLVLCHLPAVAGPVAAMAACLRPGGRLIISDFHYMCLAIGWRTRFDHGGCRYTIENYQHSYGEFLQAFLSCGLNLTALEDIMVDDTLRASGMGEVVDKWEGFPFGMLVTGLKEGPVCGG